MLAIGAFATTTSVDRATGLSRMSIFAPLSIARKTVSPPVSTRSASPLKSARMAVGEPGYRVTWTSRPSRLK